MLANEDEAVREWLVEAEKLVESFRETRALFLTSRVCSLLQGKVVVVAEDPAASWVSRHVSEELEKADG